MNFIQSISINDAIFRRNKSSLVDLPDNYSLIPILVDCGLGGWLVNVILPGSPPSAKSKLSVFIEFCAEIRACDVIKHRHRRNVTCYQFFDYHDFHH